LDALSGLGLESLLNSSSSSSNKPAEQQPQRQQHWRQRQQHAPLILTLKIAGVHWWYNSTSHASELTAGYYNTNTRDGYSPILEMCEKYGVNLTLTCVEMCDAQHPSYALCGPEGLLRQIRLMAAKRQVTLSGENALPIFTVGGVDAVALDRVVTNVRACRAAPLRSCSSWPVPATTSNDGYAGSQQQYVMQGYHQQQQQQQQWQYQDANWQQQQQHDAGSHFSRACGTPPNPSGGGGAYYHSGSYLYGQQQHHAYHYHYGAGMGAGGNILSTGSRTFSELGTLLHAGYGTYSTVSAATSGAQDQGRTGLGMAAAMAAAAGGGVGFWGQQNTNGSSGAGQQQRQQQQQGDVFVGESHPGEARQQGDVQLLPPMRAFTFLRLGPEILQPECHACWMRFMHRMLNERA